MDGLEIKSDSVEAELLFKEYGTYCELVGVRGEAYEIHIPASYNEKPVRVIGAGAFKNCDKLEEVVISEGIATIGNEAFSGCTELNIHIPKSVTSIGADAFSGCDVGNLYIPSLEKWCEISFDGENANPKAYCLILDGEPISDLVIPSTVTSIPDYAFCCNGALKSVIIKDGVRSVGKSAFNYCTNLSYIELAESVEELGDRAFYDCLSLRELTIPKKVLTIGEELLGGCRLLEKITVPFVGEKPNPTGVRERDSFFHLFGGEEPEGDGIFVCIPVGNVSKYIPEALRSVTVSGGEIHPYAFKHSRLTSITLSDSITKIGEFAFEHCSDIKSLTIPEGVKYIGEGAFAYCSSLESLALPIPSTNADALTRCYAASTLGYYFEQEKTSNNIEIKQGEDKHIAYCPSSLRSVTVTGERIPNSALAYFNNLSEIYIGEGVREIGMHAFTYCTGIKSISIPNSVKEIKAFAFYGCGELKGVYITSLSAWCDINFEDQTANPLFNANALYLDGSLIRKLIIPNNVTRIGTFAFTGLKGITSVSLPSTLISIGDNAFDGCTELTEVHIEDLSAFCEIDFADEEANPLFYAKKLYINGRRAENITLPEGISKIGSYAFAGFEGLDAQLKLPDSVTEIGEAAFKLSGIEEIVIPDSVRSLGAFAFEQTKLREIKLGCGITEIKEFTFTDCHLEKIDIPDSVEIIGFQAFKNCNLLTELVIPKSVRVIESRAFEECFGLDRVTFLGAPDTVAKDTFAGIPAICEVRIPASAAVAVGQCYISEVVITSGEKIPSGAFKGCLGLKKVTFPSELREIGESAFEQCGIEELNLPEGITRIGSSAFAGCASLSSVTLPGSLGVIGEEAFFDCRYIESVSIPKSVTKIGFGAFGNAAANFKKSDTGVCACAFYGCLGLREVVLSEGIYEIKNFAFISNSKKLKRIVFEEPDGWYSTKNEEKFLEGKTSLFGKKKFTNPENCAIELKGKLSKYYWYKA